MRIGLVLMLACCLAMTGCVAAIGNRVDTDHGQTVARKPVVVDGRIYIVDVRTGEVMALGEDAPARAGYFEAVEIDEDDD